MTFRRYYIYSCRKYRLHTLHIDIGRQFVREINVKLLPRWKIFELRNKLTKNRKLHQHISEREQVMKFTSVFEENAYEGCLQFTVQRSPLVPALEKHTPH